MCPPLPNSPTYDSVMHTFYVWGDMDFDDYGGGSRSGTGKAAEKRRGAAECEVPVSIRFQ